MRALSKVIKWAAIGLCSGVGFYFLSQQPIFKINSITVSALSDQDMYMEVPSLVKAKLLPYKGESLFGVSLREIVRLTEQDSRVGGARVFRRFPGRLKVELILRKPYALTYSRKGELVPVGRDGSLLPALSPGEFVSLPILRGTALLNSESLRKELIDFLTQVPSVGRFSFKSISEVWYSKKKGFTFFVSPDGSEVRLGLGLDSDKVFEIDKVLKYMASNKLSGRVIDARFSKKVVVRLRNEN